MTLNLEHMIVLFVSAETCAASPELGLLLVKLVLPAA